MTTAELSSHGDTAILTRRSHILRLSRHVASILESRRRGRGVRYDSYVSVPSAQTSTPTDPIERDGGNIALVQWCNTCLLGGKMPPTRGKTTLRWFKDVTHVQSRVMKCRQREEMVYDAVDPLSRSGGKQNTCPTSSNMVLDRYCSWMLSIKMQTSLRFSKSGKYGWLERSR